VVLFLVSVLSETSQRRLAVQWDDLLEKQKLTEEHITEYDRKRNSLFDIAARRATPGWQHAKKSAGELGVGPSVRVAVGRFRAIEWEYWLQWCSSSAPYEKYRAWLERLKGDVLARLESIWRAHSDLSDRWFRGTCAPAIEKQLAAVLKERVAQARDIEIRRPELAARDLRPPAASVSSPTDGAMMDLHELPHQFQNAFEAVKVNAELDYATRGEQFPHHPHFAQTGLHGPTLVQRVFFASSAKGLPRR